MEAYIKDISRIGNNHSRFGKTFPKEETRICIREYFNCDAQREIFIAEKLARDPNLEFNLVKPPDATIRQIVETINAEVMEEKKQPTIRLEETRKKRSK